MRRTLVSLAKRAKEQKMERPRNSRLLMEAAQVNPLEVQSFEPAFDDQEVQELTLLLHGTELAALLEAARQEGLTVAALVRYLVRDYLCWTRSELGKVLGRKLRTTDEMDPGAYPFTGRG
jgi:tmRNA-binding protein